MIEIDKSLDPGPFYHGTKANMKAGDLLEPGYSSNYGTMQKMRSFRSTIKDGTY